MHTSQSLIGKTTFTKISQNKTLEAFSRRIYLSTDSRCIYSVLFNKYSWKLIVISILIGIFAPLGDLAESKSNASLG
ncbi:phosphatidate cytidylyltransferase [Ornithobacterium rhinotracheale]|uniref:phosphatidate cytidylyltransferase n=1 Tax=Ornithobacterium rhinotracheale TaxID=28251 RepID=UPI00374C9B8F